MPAETLGLALLERVFEKTGHGFLWSCIAKRVIPRSLFLKAGVAKRAYLPSQYPVKVYWKPANPTHSRPADITDGGVAREAEDRRLGPLRSGGAVHRHRPRALPQAAQSSARSWSDAATAMTAPSSRPCYRPSRVAFGPTCLNVGEYCNESAVHVIGGKQDVFDSIAMFYNAVRKYTRNGRLSLVGCECGKT